jgi:histidinol-phosphatase (PHP family)
MTPLALLTAYPLTPARFDLAAFCGRWYIVQSNLALWQRYANPTITYTHLPGPGVPQLLDVVTYTKANGQQGQITGIDRVDEQHERLLRWRGNRWYTRWLTSHWCIVDHDPHCAEWAVTYFSATPFTKAGIDLYARTPTLSREQSALILARLQQQPFLREQTTTLFTPQQQGFNDSRSSTQNNL